jgi:Lon protease-like protein
MFPLGTVLFPGGLLALHVFEERYRALVADCLAGEGRFGVVLIERGSEVGGGDRRVAVGTEARIEATQCLDDGRWALVVRGVQRIEAVAWLGEAPYPSAEVRDRPDEAPDVDAAMLARVESAVRRVRTLASELGWASALDDRELEALEPAAGDPDDVGGALWRLCEAAPLTAFDRQRLLEAPDSVARAALLIGLARALGDDLAALL